MTTYFRAALSSYTVESHNQIKQRGPGAPPSLLIEHSGINDIVLLFLREGQFLV